MGLVVGSTGHIESDISDARMSSRNTSEHAYAGAATTPGNRRTTMNSTYLSNDSERHQCPHCASTNWVRDDSVTDGIKLHTVPTSRPGNLGCNNCGHSWATANG